MTLAIKKRVPSDIYLKLAKARKAVELSKGKIEPEYRALHRTADYMQPIIRAKIAKSIRKFQSTVRLKDIAILMEQELVYEVYKLIDWNKFDDILQKLLADDIELLIARGAKTARPFMDKFIARTPIEKVSPPFSTNHPKTKKWMREHLVKIKAGIEVQSIKAIEAAVLFAHEKGLNPRASAKLIRGSIGLNDKQAKALANYRFNLEFRKRTFTDELGILHTYHEPTYINPSKIDKLVGGYSDRLIKDRADVIARTETINAVNRGQLESWDQAEEAGYIKPGTKKRWITTPDDLSCDSCLALDSVTIDRSAQFQSLDFGSVDAPALHPNCFDGNTEVLTNNGWQYFRNIKGCEKFLSIDLETKNAYWTKAIKKIEYYYKGIMHQFISRYCDILTTPNHNHVVKFRDMSKKGKKDHSVWKLYEGLKLPKTKYSLLASIPDWIGDNPQKIEIGHLFFDTELFCEFLGYYLSEGSISKPTRGTWQIKISQNNSDKKKKMIECAKKLFSKIWNGKHAFYVPIYESSLVRYFMELGKSWEKYIPIKIKDLDKEYLRIFLNAYLLGDGTIRKDKKFKDHIFKGGRIYFTSSDRMASDIGELILKINKRPSYKKTQIRTIKFKNGTYTIKHPCWVISECNNIAYSVDTNMRKKDISYEGTVYDVELERYHTLITRRNGKVVVSGNCRCAMELVLE